MEFHSPSGVTIDVQSHGAGTPCLVLVHGGLCDHHDWDLQAAELRSSFRVVTLDMPGHGRSGPASGHGVAHYGSLLAEVIRHFGGRRPMVVGHSLGCQWALAATRELEVGGLVLIDGGLADESMARGVREGLEQLGEQEFSRLAFDAMFAPGDSGPTRRRIVDRAVRSSPGLARSLLLSSLTWGQAEAALALQELDAPVLLIQSTTLGDDFRFRPLQSGESAPWTEFVKGHLPSARIEQLVGIGHFAMLDAADSVTRAIREFALSCSG